MGELLTRWSARLAMTLYVLSLAWRVSASGKRSGLALARLLWTAGCLVFLLHTAFAFHFYHHWSHRDAYETTARQTADVVGLDWGGGLYANYLFTVLWTVDVCWWWIARDRYLTRSRGLEWAVQGFMGFMAFNATVVFGTGAVRWIGVMACLILGALLGYRWRRHRGSSSRS